MSKSQRFQLLQHELQESYAGLQEEFKNEPHSRQMIDAFDGIEQILRMKCQ